MSSFQSLGRAAAVVAAMLLALSLAGCGSSKPNYTFVSDPKEVTVDGEGVVDVRLIHEPTGKPVENAVIFETRFDMAPDAMAAMMGPVTAQRSPAPGVYRFAVKPTMAGRWQLTLSAKVQGVAETVTGSVIVTAR